LSDCSPRIIRRSLRYSRDLSGPRKYVNNSSVEGSTQGRFDSRPLLVFWEMTKACQLACFHCRADAQLTGGDDELSTREGLKLIDSLAGLGKPRPILILTGGDCLMRDDIVELAAYANSLN